jgi:hypothetical protein
VPYVNGRLGEENRTLAAASDNDIAPELVHEELQRILTSRHFRSSRRGKEFLQFVVEQKLQGNGDVLKERLIGNQIFRRKPDYPTGEDAVVRVQAGDVRRRLDLYNAHPDPVSRVLLQIPLGSYAPVFRWRSDHHWSDSHPDSESGLILDPASVPPAAPATGPVLSLVETFEMTAADQPQSARGASARPVRAGHRSAMSWWLIALSVFAGAVCLLMTGWLLGRARDRSAEPAVKAFWMPALLSPNPVLLCVPKPLLYRPSDELFNRYAKTHANALNTREERRNDVLPLQPDEPLRWDDMVPVRNSGPAIGGVIAAVNLSRLLTEQGKHYEVRFGREASYAEMRDSPVVIVGGINTTWSTQLVSGLHFVFDESRSIPTIREMTGAKRVWGLETGSDGTLARDFGLITRQLSGRSGQFLVQVAGISDIGTAAASELLSNQKELASALGNAPVDLQKKNLQIVVATDVTDGKAGPPRVIAVSNW